MKKLLIWIALLPFFQVFANSSDSLIRFEDLVFKSDPERAAFRKYAAGKDSVDLVDLLLSPYEMKREVNAAQAHKMIDQCIAGLQNEISSKPESKRTKVIYDYVHKKFLKVYKLINSFPDIFEKGEYNCVSASALYAIVFSRLNIPYQIKESPQHVYLIAYPETHKFMIETTRPDNGYYRFNDDFIRRYVNSLVAAKIISKEESETVSVNTLFDKHYFASESITLLQLAGLQYSNYAVYNMEEKKYENAINEIKKSNYLYSCERNKYLLKSTLLYQIGNNNYSDTNQVNNLAMICRYHEAGDQEVSSENIKGEFSRLMETQLINNSAYEQFDASYEKIAVSLKDSVLRNDISFLYHSELARLGYVNMKDDEYQIKHLKGAYRINPRNANLQSLILAHFGTRVLKGADAGSALKQMDEFSESFDFLKTNVPFNKIKINCLLELSYQSFAMNEITKGENYLKQFEKICNDEKSLEPSAEFVERAYSSACGVYYKKGNYPKAKQFVKTGLIYAPQSFGLKQRLSQF